MRLRNLARKQGLSPRVRGNPLLAYKASISLGSIPACAGEPRNGFKSRATVRVYPRVCGGTRLAMGISVQYKGLSPRVRGNLVELADRIDIIGSIPACAGEPLAARILILIEL